MVVPVDLTHDTLVSFTNWIARRMEVWHLVESQIAFGDIYIRDVVS